MSTDHLTEKQLSKAVLKHGLSILDKCVTDPLMITPYLEQIYKEQLKHYPIPKTSFDPDFWFMPNEYKKLDIEEFLVNQCPKENYDRLIQELSIYRQKNLLNLLKMMKYIVDTLRSNGIFWGVGRGSSVSSYVLFLLGVHRIDSVKYSLPLNEFFKGE